MVGSESNCTPPRWEHAVARFAIDWIDCCLLPRAPLGACDINPVPVPVAIRAVVVHGRKQREDLLVAAQRPFEIVYREGCKAEISDSNRRPVGPVSAEC